LSAELHLARRYLLGLGRRTDVAIVTLISFVGLALSVLALVLTLAMLEGFQSSIRDELVARAAHARLSPARGRVLHHPDELASLLHRRLPDVEMIQVVRGACLVSTMVDAVPASVEGRSDVDDVACDRVLSARVGAGFGDHVQVLSARQRLTPMGPLPVRMQLEIDRVVPPPTGAEAGWLILPLARAQRLLWGRPAVDALELRDVRDPWSLGRRVRQVLAGAGRAGSAAEQTAVEGIEVEGIEQLNRSLLLALALEKVMIFIAVGLMLVVAALNLVCNVGMVAAQKRADLAVLAGLGMTPVALRRLFLWLGLGIGGLGSLLGAVVGVPLAIVLDVTGAVPPPGRALAIASVPFKVQPGAVAVVLALALGLAALAAWIPSRLVARRDPAVGLRYE
jgi:lipoprotein-releasing system permease protein